MKKTGNERKKNDVLKRYISTLAVELLIPIVCLLGFVIFSGSLLVSCSSSEEEVAFEDLSLDEKREKTKALGLMVYEVTQTDLSSTSVTINFYTVEETESELLVGLDVLELDDRVQSMANEPSIEHAISITGLSPSTTYYVKPVATDSNGKIFQDPSFYPVTTKSTADDKAGQFVALVPDAVIVSSTLGGAEDEPDPLAADQLRPCVGVEQHAVVEAFDAHDDVHDDRGHQAQQAGTDEHPPDLLVVARREPVDVGREESPDGGLLRGPVGSVRG